MKKKWLAIGAIAIMLGGSATTLPTQNVQASGMHPYWYYSYHGKSMKVITTKDITIHKIKYKRNSPGSQYVSNTTKKIPAGTELKAVAYDWHGFGWLFSNNKYANWCYPHKSVTWFDAPNEEGDQDDNAKSTSYVVTQPVKVYYAKMNPKTWHYKTYATKTLKPGKIIKPTYLNTGYWKVSGNGLSGTKSKYWICKHSSDSWFTTVYPHNSVDISAALNAKSGKYWYNFTKKQYIQLIKSGIFFNNEGQAKVNRLKKLVKNMHPKKEEA